MRLGFLNGKPVANTLPCNSRLESTRKRISLSLAPSPRTAVNNSFLIGSYTTPTSVRPLTRIAMETEKCGKPLIKLVVPSSGSITH